MTTVEPEWDQRARDEIIASVVVDDRTCTSCSSDLVLSTDADLAAVGVDVNDDVICFVCRAKEAHQRALNERHEKHPEWWDGRSLVAALVSTDKGVADGGS